MAGRKKDMSKEPIRLRAKDLKNGGKSLYLDIYFEGMRRYEFLKLYLKPDKRENKVENANTLRLANAIKAKRIIELQNRKYDFFNQDVADADLLEYMVERARRSQGEGQGNRGILGTAMRSAELLRQYSGKQSIPIKVVDKSFVSGYSTFLKSAKSKRGILFSRNSQYNLFMSLVSALNSAVRDGIIMFSPISQMTASEKPKSEKGIRSYLTIDEVKRLYETDYPASPYSKQIFLFGCMCGLRYSDIISLRWKNLDFQDDDTVMMNIRQKKTKKEISMPLSKETVKLLPAREDQDKEDYVFGCFDVIVGRSVHDHLQKWAKMAGITKHISFHTSRHTFATMLLTLGADLYTVSKLLGHTNIKTTQIYAEVINQKKQDAVDLIPTFSKNK